MQPSENKCYPAIIDLAAYVENEYAKVNYESKRFAAIAHAGLAQFKQYHFITTEHLSQWLATQTAPQQLQPNPQLNLFGEPPLTLYWSTHFVIDVYFWRSTDTVIHDHGFNGAFTVVAGLTLQTEYSFETTEDSICDGIKIGKLIRTNMSYLNRDNAKIMSIPAADKLIHATAHLKNPTVTLCVRTITEPNSQQYNYYPPGLAITVNQHFNTSTYLAIMPLLHACALPELFAYVSEIILHKNLATCAYVLQYFLALTGDITYTKNLLKKLAGRYKDKFCQAIAASVDYIYYYNNINSSKAQSTSTKSYCEILKSSYNQEMVFTAIENLFSTQLSRATAEELCAAALKETALSTKPQQFLLDYIGLAHAA